MPYPSRFERRVERLFLWIAVTLFSVAWSARARAEPIRILVTASYGRGLVEERPLRFTERDTRRVADVFTSVGRVKKDHVLGVDDATRASLEAAFSKARALAETHRPEEVSVFFYFSGHGDRQNLHLKDGLFPRAALATLLGGVRASLRIAVTDACRTELVREKGISLEPAFDVSMDPGADATGAVWIHASANGESSQESEDLEGSIFTHYFVNGLLGAGDVDGDGRVTLHEAYAFAYHQTLLRSARGAGSLQRPSASFDLKEGAPLTLTELGKTSTLRLPRGEGRYYLVYSPRSHTVRAEIWGAPDRTIALATTAGRYVVQRRGGGDSGAADVVVGSGETKELRSEDFRPMSEETLAEKGGNAFERTNDLAIGYGGVALGLVDYGHAAHVTLRHHFGNWTLGGGPFGGLGKKTTALEEGELAWLGGDAFLARRIPFGTFSLELGAGGGAQWTHQAFVRSDRDRLGTAGYQGDRSSSALVSSAFLHAEGRFELGERAFLGVRLRGGAQFASVSSSVSALLLATTSAELGFTF